MPPEYPRPREGNQTGRGQSLEINQLVMNEHARHPEAPTEEILDLVSRDRQLAFEVFVAKKHAIFANGFT